MESITGRATVISNMRAELAKRLLRDNVGPSGEIGTDRFLWAMMQYRNTPHPDTRLSPAQVVLGHQIRDFLPVIKHKYEPKQEWGLIQEARDRVMARKLDRDGSRLEMYTKHQKVIPVGDSVAVQNQTGRFPTKWDKTGTVIENMNHDKVRIRLDGSRQITVRNRRFVKKIVSPPDLPSQGEVEAPVSESEQHMLESPESQRDKIDHKEDDHAVNIDHQQEGQLQLPSMADSGDIVDPEQLAVVTPPAAVSRPKRNRIQNVKYSPEEYDLSTVSSVGRNLQLLGIYVKRRPGGKIWK